MYQFRLSILFMPLLVSINLLLPQNARAMSKAIMLAEISNLRATLEIFQFLAVAGTIGSGALVSTCLCCECDKSTKLEEENSRLRKTNLRLLAEKSGVEEVIPFVKRIGQKQEDEIAQLNAEIQRLKEERSNIESQANTQIAQLENRYREDMIELRRRRTASPERRAQIAKLEKDLKQSRDAYASCKFTNKSHSE